LAGDYFFVPETPPIGCVLLVRFPSPFLWVRSRVCERRFAQGRAELRPMTIQNEQFPASNRSTTFRQVASLQRRRQHASDLLTAFDAKVRCLLHRREDQKSGQNGRTKSRCFAISAHVYQCREAKIYDFAQVREEGKSICELLVSKHKIYAHPAYLN